MAGRLRKRDGLKPLTLAAILMVCAGGLTGLSLARPTPMSVANALMFWVWAASALRFARMKDSRRVCAACGAVDPLKLPDGGCAMCASPVKRCFPGLAKPAEQPVERPATSW